MVLFFRAVGGGSPQTGEGQEESQGQRQVRAMKHVPREEVWEGRT